MKTILLLIAAVLLLSCQQRVDREKIREEILGIHQELIKAHLEKNLELLVHNLSDTYISVKNGDILRPDKDEVRAGLTDYITNTTFTEYIDLQEPVIGLSDDGTVAWAIVQVKVKGYQKQEDAPDRETDFICAWLTIYRRVKNDWVVDVEVSTFK